MTLIRSGFARGHQWRRRVRGLILRAWITAWGGSAGPGLMVDLGVHLRHPPGRGWKLGDGVYLGRGAILDVWPGATFEIGSGTKIMHYTVLAARQSLTIGARAQVAENSTVRDSNHGIEAGQDILTSPMVVRPVAIGDGAWVARGVAVLPGAIVGDGAVIGANSVVTGEVPADTIAVGSPARVLRSRAEARGRTDD